MLKIEMLNEDGEVIDTCPDVHRCVGDPRECEYSARCEDCGHEANAENPVYAWSASDGMWFFACSRCLSVDLFARLRNA